MQDSQMLRMRDVTLPALAVVGLLLMAMAAVSGCGGQDPDVEPVGAPGPNSKIRVGPDLNAQISSGPDPDGKLTGELFSGSGLSIRGQGDIWLVDVTGWHTHLEWNMAFNGESARAIATGDLGSDRREGRVSFTINYNPASIDPESDYAVIARYYWSWWSSTQMVGESGLYSNIDGLGVLPTLVLTKGRPHKDVQVELGADLRMN